jgi:hypothetical protein
VRFGFISRLLLALGRFLPPGDRMSALTLHLIIGLVAGTRFGAQTLVVLAVAVLLEGVASFMVRCAYTELTFLLFSQCALQFGYLGGVCLRSILERADLAVGSARPSPENHVQQNHPHSS